MHSKLFALSSLAILAAATPTPRTTTPSDLCCNQVTSSSSDPDVLAISKLLNINVSDINVPIGLNCVPITVVGGGAAGCNGQAVTCDADPAWGGLIGINCVPIVFRRNDTPPPSTPSDQCCEQVTTAGDSGASTLIGLLNINVSNINVPVGLNCVPITVVGGGAAGCNKQAVTCDAADPKWGGLIAIGCVPIVLRRTETPPPDTSGPQCCQQTTTAGDPSASTLIGLLNINVSNINVPVGLNCVPITVVGSGSSGCNAQTVTCDAADPKWGGLIAINCLPIVLRRTETPPPSTAGPQCCQQTTTAGDPSASTLIGLLNINVSNINVPVGLNCVPITVVGSGSSGCNAQTVTCDAADPKWGGLIAINCLPIVLRRTETPPPSTAGPQCCQQTTTASDPQASTLIGLLNINVSNINVPVGLNCVPITVVGDGSSGCNAQTVTCDAADPKWGGLIAINCLPIVL